MTDSRTPDTATPHPDAPEARTDDACWTYPDPVLEAFGNRIRDYRTAAGLTQRLLAERVGLTRASIGNIEAGFQDVGVRRLVRLASALDTTPAALLAPGLEPANAAEARERGRMRALEAENERLRRMERRVRAALDHSEESDHA
ncbi:MAG TPA: helix-turn-helix transcriptional regulator [Jiangellaceae bacterium]